MSDRGQVFVIDRIEGKLAVVVSDADESTTSVLLSMLPDGAAEGDVLRVPLKPDGEPQWAGAVLDEALRAQRAEEIRAQLDALKRRDPGGDIVM